MRITNSGLPKDIFRYSNICLSYFFIKGRLFNIARRLGYSTCEIEEYLDKMDIVRDY